MFVPRWFVWPALASFFQSTHTVFAQTASAKILQEICEEYNLPAIGVLDVASSGEGRRAVSGIRKWGDSVVVTTEDKFHLGSLTKAMTATLVAILVENDILTWNMTLWEALPTFRDAMNLEHRGTTLEMLAAHYSGIEKESAWSFTLKSYDENLSAVASRQQLTAYVLSNKPSSTPNTTWEYSNANYVILGHIIDEHAPQVWEDYIQSALWKPLNMTGCGFGTPIESSPSSIDNPWPHVAGSPPRPYSPLRDNSDNPTFYGPAGTVHCDMHSYSRFLKMHLDALNGLDTTVLPASSFEKLHIPFFTGSTYTSGAWFARTNRQYGGRYLFHDGTNLKNYAIAMLAPGEDRAMAAFTNVGDALSALGEARAALFNGSLKLDDTALLSSSSSVALSATRSPTAARTSSPATLSSPGSTNVLTASSTAVSPSSSSDAAHSSSQTHKIAWIAATLLSVIYIS